MTGQSHRAYPLDIQELVNLDDEVIGVWSKGHHPAGCALAGPAGDAFLTAVTRYLAERGHGHVYGHGHGLDAAAVAFETWRCVPARFPADEPRVLFHPATLGQRGAFPVTVLYLDDLMEEGAA